MAAATGRTEGRPPVLRVQDQPAPLALGLSPRQRPGLRPSESPPSPIAIGLARRPVRALLGGAGAPPGHPGPRSPTVSCGVGRGSPGRSTWPGRGRGQAEKGTVGLHARPQALGDRGCPPIYSETLPRSGPSRRRPQVGVTSRAGTGTTAAHGVSGPRPEEAPQAAPSAPRHPCPALAPTPPRQGHGFEVCVPRCRAWR